MRSIVMTGKALDVVVVARVIAERALVRGLVAGGVGCIGADEALEDDFRGGRHLQIMAHALDDFRA
jgi:hypothetical protein